MSSHQNPSTFTSTTTTAAPFTHGVAGIPSPSHCVKLDDTNYTIWRAQLLPLLTANSLVSIIDGSEPCPQATLSKIEADGSVTNYANPAYQNWIIRDQLALGWILTSASPAIVTSLTRHSTSSAAWKALEAEHAAKSAARASTLRLELQSMNKGNKRVSELLRHAFDLADRLAAVGQPVADAELQHHIFRALGPAFESVGEAIHILHKADAPNREELRGMLLAREARMDIATVANPPPPTAFVHQHRPSSQFQAKGKRTPTCQICR